MLRQPKAGQAFRPKAGQALVEMLPSLIIFFMVLSAGLSYFRIMRAGALRQEALRNLVFAKINYSGTLTTSTLQRGSGVFIDGLFQGSSESAIARGPANEVFQSANCFTVSAHDTRLKIEPSYIYGIGLLKGADIEMTSYATMYRYPGGGCP